MSPENAMKDETGEPLGSRTPGPGSGPGIRCRRRAPGRLVGAILGRGRSVLCALAIVLAMPTAVVGDDLSSVVPPEEEATFLVSNPPQGFVAVIGGLGFSVVEETRLEELALQIYRVQGPQDRTVDAAMDILMARFPGLEIDRDTELDLNSDK
jgi:hypothetical protein